MKQIYGDLSEFNFSNNPKLKISQIIEFLHINQFPCDRVKCWNVQCDAAIPDGFVCFDSEQIFELEELSFDMIESKKQYDNCKILYLQDAQLE